MLVPLSGREKESTRKLPENSHFGKVALAAEVTRYFFFKGHAVLLQANRREVACDSAGKAVGARGWALQ